MTRDEFDAALLLSGVKITWWQQEIVVLDCEEQRYWIVEGELKEELKDFADEHGFQAFTTSEAQGNEHERAKQLQTLPVDSPWVQMFIELADWKAWD